MGEVYKAMMSLGYVSYIRLKHTKTSDLSPPETISAEFDVSSNGNICLCIYRRWSAFLIQDICLKGLFL